MFSGLSLGRRRTGWAAAAAVAVGTAITIVAINGASASHSGDGSVGLSATNGTKTINWQGGTPSALALTNDTVTDGAWSPDGSRMVFVNQHGAIETVRFNNAADTGIIVAADGDARSHPTWTDDGSVTLWSAHVTDPTTHDTIEFAIGSSGDWNTVNLDAGTNWTHPDAGAGSTILVQGQVGSGTPNIYSIDESKLFDATVAPGTPLVQNGTSPAASPNDDSVAFLRSDGSNVQVWVFDPATNTTTQVTSDAKDHSNPTWSPDGKTIAFDEGTNVFTAPADGTQKATPVNASLAGVPAYQSKEQDLDVRFAGENRYETAISVSQGNWADAGDPDFPTADAVVLSRGDTFADALGGSALAAAKNGPLLLTPPTALFADTKTEIQRLLGPDKTKTVYLVGGTSALSTTIENSIAALYKTVRLAGDNRYDTAVKVANAINPNPGYVFAATGLNFPDALSAGAAAGSFDVPGSGTSAVIVLTADGVMPTATSSYLTGVENSSSPPTIVGIGQPASDALLTMPSLPSFGIAGENRYDTAEQVADFFFAGAEVFGVATGTNFPDALSGGALLGTLGGPLLLTPPTAAYAPVTGYLSLNSASYFAELGFGGSDVVAAKVMSAYATAISGPEPFFNAANLLHTSTGGKSAARSQHIDVTPKARAQKASERQLPDFTHLPSYVKKLH